MLKKNNVIKYVAWAGIAMTWIMVIYITTKTVSEANLSELTAQVKPHEFWLLLFVSVLVFFAVFFCSVAADGVQLRDTLCWLSATAFGLAIHAEHMAWSAPLAQLQFIHGCVLAVFAAFVTQSLLLRRVVEDED